MLRNKDSTKIYKMKKALGKLSFSCCSGSPESNRELVLTDKRRCFFFTVRVNFWNWLPQEQGRIVRVRQQLVKITSKKCRHGH